MILPDQQHKIAVPLTKLKQYFERIRLPYTEQRNGNATIICVQSNRQRADTGLATHFVNASEARRF